MGAYRQIGDPLEFTMDLQSHEGKETVMKHGVRKVFLALVGLAVLFLSCQAVFAEERVTELNVPACGA